MTSVSLQHLKITWKAGIFSSIVNQLDFLILNFQCLLKLGLQSQGEHILGHFIVHGL
jgi:hypothetical protein